MLRKSILALLVVNATGTLANATPTGAANGAPPIDNPIVVQRADPQIIQHKDGCYTFIGTSPAFDQIALRQACKLNDLKLHEEKVIWKKRDEGAMSANIWAPELHNINGAWYIYFAAGDKAQPFSIRMYVLENKHSNPMQGEWSVKGKIDTGLDTFSLDATVYNHNDKHYLIWAQQNKARSYNSALWIAELADPVTLATKPVIISEPTLDWEVQGYKVNEGAALIRHQNKIFMTYSASATDHRYAMGLLWADADSDLLDPASWTKSQQPVFETDGTLGRYGPGHNSFVKSDDGTTDLMIYHSRDYKELKGTPLTDPNRHARARVIVWDENGFPDFRPLLTD